MIADKHRLELNPTEFTQLLLEKMCLREKLQPANVLF